MFVGFLPHVRHVAFKSAKGAVPKKRFFGFPTKHFSKGIKAGK